MSYLQFLLQQFRFSFEIQKNFYESVKIKLCKKHQIGSKKQMKNDKKRPNKKLKQETTKIITLKLIKNTQSKMIVY